MCVFIFYFLIEGNKSKGVKFTNKPKSEVLKSTTTSESNIELENIKKQLGFICFKIKFKTISVP